MISYHGNITQFGIHVMQNLTKAFEIFSELAAQGSPAGQMVRQLYCTTFRYNYFNMSSTGIGISLFYWTGG